MNRGQLVTRVGQKLSFDLSSGSEELTLLRDLANEGVVEVLINTRCHVDLGELTLTSGVKDYRLDASVLAILNRTIESSYSPLNVVGMDDMLDFRRGGSVASPARFLAAEGDFLAVYPTPTASEVIRFVYVAKPTPMTDDAHDPSNATYGGIPSEYHRAIEYFMLWQGAEYDDKAAPQRPSDIRALFEAECRLVRKRHRAKSGRGLAPARVGYPGTQRFPRRNDTYPA